MPRCLVLLTTAAALVLSSCEAPGPDPATGDLSSDVQQFLDDYTTRYVELSYEADLADWEANTRIVEGDDTNRLRAEETAKELAAFTGSVEVIEKTRAFLERRSELTDLQARQLESVLFRAANNPQTVPDVVARRIAAETRQTESLFGFEFQVDGRSLSANDIDDILTSSNDLAERRAVWEASKEVGKVLKDGLAELVELRNETARALGYESFFHYQVSDYGMTVDEMMELNRGFVRDLWPLYRELHTWARHELARRYGASDVPDVLPAHWLPNRWAQDWTELVEVEGIDLNRVLADKDAEWIVRQAEEFYVSLGFDPLPDVFWERSSLYPLPDDAGYKKNNHASAWHLDLGGDVRSLMSVQPNQRWWQTTHHELGHIYYYMGYTRPEVPVLLRRGANRAFHEGVGTLLGKASMLKSFLSAKGLVDGNAPADDDRSLLKQALDEVVFIPWSAGVMTHFEHDLYAGGLAKGEYNARWWSYVRSFQGVEPPAERGEEHCDAASKTHISNDAAQYYDYAISHVILHQLHAHISNRILGEDPRSANYLGREDVGDFLRGILESGATRDWREVMRENLGEEISAAPMLAYYGPLLDYLRKENEGREHTLPESPEIRASS